MPGSNGITVVRTGETPPEAWTASLFLAGPSPRDSQVPSWRPEALKEITSQWQQPGRLVVFVPESRDGQRSADHTGQLSWEHEHRAHADVILYWVPHDPTNTPVPSTNIEFGIDMDSGRVILGYPDTAVHVRLLQTLADGLKVPTARTLAKTVALALERIGEGAPRAAGHRDVPLLLWTTPSFRRWLAAQEAAGNELRGGTLSWTFRVGPDRTQVLFWAYRATVFVRAEQRLKDNEIVLGRPDPATVVACLPAADWEDSQVVLVREFRSPARTPDGYIREFPGGSAPEAGDMRQMAADEFAEETGLRISANRLHFVGTRQPAGTLSAHVQSVYTVELTVGELEQLKGDTARHGNVAESEQTFVEIVRVGDLLNSALVEGTSSVGAVDWATVGMVSQALRSLSQ